MNTSGGSILFGCRTWGTISWYTLMNPLQMNVLSIVNLGGLQKVNRRALYLLQSDRKSGLFFLCTLTTASLIGISLEGHTIRWCSSISSTKRLYRIRHHIQVLGVFWSWITQRYITTRYVFKINCLLMLRRMFKRCAKMLVLNLFICRHIRQTSTPSKKRLHS